MEHLAATTNVVRKRAGPFLLVALFGALPATSALAETFDDLIVKGAACVGNECTNETFPFDALRIHGPEPLLSMVDSDGMDNDWSIGITDGGTGSPSEFFIRDEVSGQQVLRMNVDGAVALGAGAELVPGAVSVAWGGNERRVTGVADAVDDTDAVNLRQFEQELEGIHDRIDGLFERIETLAREVE